LEEAPSFSLMLDAPQWVKIKNRAYSQARWARGVFQHPEDVRSLLVF